MEEEERICDWRMAGRWPSMAVASGDLKIVSESLVSGRLFLSVVLSALYW